MEEEKKNHDKIIFSKKAAWIGFISYVLLFILIMIVIYIG